MRIVLRIELDFDSDREASAVYSALLPETKRPPTDRSKSTIRLNGKKVFIEINSEDLTSIRAAFNSYMRMINAVSECLYVVDVYDS